MGNCCCKKKSKISDPEIKVHAVLIDQDKNIQDNHLESDSESDSDSDPGSDFSISIKQNKYVYGDRISLRWGASYSQTWLCQDRKCMVKNKILFDNTFFETHQISKTPPVTCTMCGKEYFIQWKYYIEDGILTN